MIKGCVTKPEDPSFGWMIYTMEGKNRLLKFLSGLHMHVIMCVHTCSISYTHTYPHMYAPNKYKCNQKNRGVREMAEWFRAQTALAKDQGSLLRTYVVADNYVTPVPWDPVPSSDPWKHCLHTAHGHIYMQLHTCNKSHTHVIKISLKKNSGQVHIWTCIQDPGQAQARQNISQGLGEMGTKSHPYLRGHWSLVAAVGASVSSVKDVNPGR